MRSGRLCALLMLVATTAASAQLPDASAATLGVGHDVTAYGGGFSAIASNPAGLARRDAPGFSLALPGLAAHAGVGPVELVDLADFEGRLVGTTVKDEWMSRVATDGGQTARLGAGATPLAFTAGPLGIQISSRVGGRADLAPDAVELLLFGNAGRTGEPTEFDLDGSFLEGFVVTTAAASLGVRVTDRLLFGLTGKYSVGNGLAVGRDAGSFVTGDPISVEIDFPVLMPSTDDFAFDNGTGVGMDLGLIWEGRPVALGVMVENVFNTFEWRLDGFVYVPGQALFDDEASASDFEEQPLDTASQAIRDDFEALADEYRPERRVSVGTSLALHPTLRLTGSVQKSLTDGMRFDPDFYGGVGLEWSALSFFPLRGHAAAITGGFQLGGGASLVLGPVRLSGGAALRSESKHDSVVGAFTLSFGSH